MAPEGFVSTLKAPFWNSEKSTRPSFPPPSSIYLPWGSTAWETHPCRSFRGTAPCGSLGRPPRTTEFYCCP